MRKVLKRDYYTTIVVYTPISLFENEICSRYYLLTTYVSDGSCDCCVKIDTFFGNRRGTTCDLSILCNENMTGSVPHSHIKYIDNKCYIYSFVTGHSFL